MPKLLRNSFGKTASALKNGFKLSVQDILGVGLPAFNNMYFVHAGTGSNANQGLETDAPFSTLDYAIGQCVASKGDMIVMLPGHAETVTAAIAADVAGIQIVGIGEGLLRPAITGSGTIDVISVSAANVLIENINFPAPLVDAATADINVAAAGCIIRNTRHIGSTGSENKVDIITVAAGGDDLLVEGTRAYNTVVDCVAWLSLEAAVARPVIRYNTVMGTFSTAILMDEDTATLCHIHNNSFKNTKTTGNVATFTTGNSTGIMEDNFLSGRNTTIASNLVEGTGMDFNNNKVVEQAALSGLLEPAVDAE